MRKLILLFMLPLVAFMLSCSMQDVPERHRGLAIKRPYLFGNAEVELLKPDIHAIAWTTDLVNIPVSPETISEVFDDMKTKDEEIVDFAVHIKSVLDDNGLANLYSNFGLDWYNQNIKESFRTDVRDICKNYSQTELTSNPAISREISDKLLQH
jgi:regulator of protease activity HflC (stomatin/prohibitin superfamily)